MYSLDGPITDQIWCIKIQLDNESQWTKTNEASKYVNWQINIFILFPLFLSPKPHYQAEYKYVETGAFSTLYLSMKHQRWLHYTFKFIQMRLRLTHIKIRHGWFLVFFPVSLRNHSNWYIMYYTSCVTGKGWLERTWQRLTEPRAERQSIMKLQAVLW